ncbi:MAG: DNA cytosine methyltransferase [Desulfobacterales bacterium]|nr:DNA cytosine methyltransferase [Desulfobacterales bacterium]
MIKVFDFFSGCGGTSKGFKNAGLDLICAIDNDSDAAATYEHNFPDTTFINQDITQIDTEEISSHIKSCQNAPILFSGCAPCQPFSKQKTQKKDQDHRIYLLNEFKRFVAKYLPQYIFIENVPGLQKLFKKDSPFETFLTLLKKLGYFYDYSVITSQSFGVPQRRKRLVLVASSLGEISIPKPACDPENGLGDYSTVRDWIEDLPAINAGEEHALIANHRSAALSNKNLERIRRTPEGGNRLNWPKHLWLKCHLNGYKGHTDVYGRMKWDEPATGLTTRCISLSNGRFGHPDQNRAISIREAACLQTFPMDFIFKGNLNSMARQIGNAVPVKLAEVFGTHILKHYSDIHGKIQN